jgi:hypothetical protein
MNERIWDKFLTERDKGCIRRRLTATTLGIDITEFACLSSVEASAVRPVQLQAHWRVWQ